MNRTGAESNAMCGIQYPEREIAGFLQTYSEWASAVEHDDGVVYSLHPLHVDACLQLFQLDSASKIAEHDFAKLCQRHNAIGVMSSQPIKYGLLTPPPRWSPVSDASELKGLGWESSLISSVLNSTDPTIRVRQKMRASAGRLISRPDYNDAVEALRQAWLELPANCRPQMPITAPVKWQSVTKCTLDAYQLEHAPTPLVDFMQIFGRFCADWQLLGLTTWQLPNVIGPQLVAMPVQDSMYYPGNSVSTPPWHYPVQHDDGLGEILEDEHRRDAQRWGVDDHESWGNYASFLEIHHWEKVLELRYGKGSRVRRFVTEMEFVLAEILELERDSVQKRRKLLHQLQSGSLKSLRGRR